MKKKHVRWRMIITRESTCTSLSTTCPCSLLLELDSMANGHICPDSWGASKQAQWNKTILHGRKRRYSVQNAWKTLEREVLDIGLRELHDFTQSRFDTPRRAAARVHLPSRWEWADPALALDPATWPRGQFYRSWVDPFLLDIMALMAHWVLWADPNIFL